MKIKGPKQDNFLRVAHKQKYPGICLYVELKMRTATLYRGPRRGHINLQHNFTLMTTSWLIQNQLQLIFQT